jgi:GTPase SAR1 family protein
MPYMRGAAGYLLVVDGTRRATLDTVLRLQERVEAAIGNVPFIVVLNKADLSLGWELGDEPLTTLRDRGWEVMKTSARSGAGVEEAFLTLAKKMLER